MHFFVTGVFYILTLILASLSLLVQILTQNCQYRGPRRGKVPQMLKKVRPHDCILTLYLIQTYFCMIFYYMVSLLLMSFCTAAMVKCLEYTFKWKLLIKRSSSLILGVRCTHTVLLGGICLVKLWMNSNTFLWINSNTCLTVLVKDCLRMQVKKKE